MVVVSTHDFELCNIEDREHKPAANYHFEEYYEEDRLMFDYRIRDGRCTTTNAVAILRMAGIVPLCGN
jgi:DNA mismatch repair ATPase MutS